MPIDSISNTEKQDKKAERQRNPMISLIGILPPNANLEEARGACLEKRGMGKSPNNQINFA